MKLPESANFVVVSTFSAAFANYSSTPPSYNCGGNSLAITVPFVIGCPAKSKKSEVSTKVISTMSDSEKLEM